ncbi:hypothetical protein GEMRC1_008811 [Eukaryota sp. GEM-RC1]
MIPTNITCIVCTEEYDLLHRMPVIVCSENHSFCKMCASNVTTCPTCRLPCLPECKSNIALHHVVESIRSGDLLSEIPHQELFINTEVMASGTTADVYSGTWYGLDVAIKVLRLPDVKGRRRLKRELLKLSVLNHPSIIRVFGMTYRDGGQLGIVMERASHSLRVGTSLNATTLSHAIGIANALEFLHSRDIVHGDIKPANILIVNGVAKVSDFGGAKSLMEASCTATFHYTPKYASPEVFDTEKAVLTKECDVYSLGMVLYEILCGRIAYDGLSSAQVFGAKMKKTPLEFPSDIPESLHSIINRSVSPEPKNRPTLQEIKLVLNSLDVTGDDSSQEVHVADHGTTSNELMVKNTLLNNANQQHRTEIHNLNNKLKLEEQTKMQLSDSLTTTQKQNEQLLQELDSLKAQGAGRSLNSQLMDISSFSDRLSRLLSSITVESTPILLVSEQGDTFSNDVIPLRVSHILVIIETTKGTLFGGYFPQGFGRSKSTSATTMLFHIGPLDPRIFHVVKAGSRPGFCFQTKKDSFSLFSPRYDVSVFDGGKGFENLGTAYEGQPGDLVPEKNLTSRRLSFIELRFRVKF